MKDAETLYKDTRRAEVGEDMHKACRQTHKEVRKNIFPSLKYSRKQKLSPEFGNNQSTEWTDSKDANSGLSPSLPPKFDNSG